MQKAVILTREEWDELPSRIADKLHEHSQKGWGFRIVDRESGKEIEDRLRDYIGGVVQTVFYQLAREMEQGQR